MAFIVSLNQSYWIGLKIGSQRSHKFTILTKEAVVYMKRKTLVSTFTRKKHWCQHIDKKET